MKFKNEEFEQYRQPDGKFYYLYKITNLLNGKFYYGVHSTTNLGDGYKGSGKAINRAYKKYGKSNFKREFLEFFTNADEMFKRELEIVTEELIKDSKCYNMIVGGTGGNKNKVIARSILTGEHKVLDKNSPEWMSGEYIHIATGTINVFDSTIGKCRRIMANDYDEKIHLIPNKGKVVVYNTITKKCECVSITDPRRKTGILISPSKGKTTIRHIQSQTYIQVEDPQKYIETGEYEYMNTGKWTIRDKETGQCIQVKMGSEIDWTRYEMSTCRKNKKNESNCTWAKTIKAKSYSLYWNDDPRIQSGELILRRDGTAKNRVYVNNGKISRSIHRIDLQKFLGFHKDWVVGNLHSRKSRD